MRGSALLSWKRVALAGAVATLVATASLLGGVLRNSSSAAPAVAVPRLPSQAHLDGGFSTGDTAGLIRQLQTTLRANPRDAQSYALLGLAYQQRARETGDPSYYTKAAGVLHRALALAPSDPTATSGLGSLALARHRFAEGLALGRRARALAPSSARNYGIIGDALLELGRYDEAFTAFDTMSRLRPNVASYARVSYARELLGRPRAAIAAMKLAVDSATAELEPTAWAHVQLGKIYWSLGNVAVAARHYRAALAAFPGYVYALDALAQVEAARARYARAIALEQRAVAATPLPQFVATLGDLYRVTGRPRLARRQYDLIGAIDRLLVANGVRTDLELALFDVDHGIALPRALARARRAHAERPSIEGDDVLAWALARNERCDEALRYSRRALRLGTLDALKFFHRGMIERCLGHATAGRKWLRRALALNPQFSLLWAPVARQALR